MEGKMLNNPNITKTHRGIYGIIQKENQLLVIKKARGPYKGLYDLPGGSPEALETSEETLVREISEETSLKVKKYALLKEMRVIFSDFTKASGEKGTLAHTGVLFNVTDWEGDILATSDGLDSLGAQWVDMDSLTSQNATPFALVAAGKELIHVADKTDTIISTHVRGNPLSVGRYVMIAGVMVYNHKGEVLLHKIAPHKKWGGMWTYSAAGHVDAGENYKKAAQRELKEELGLSAAVGEELTSFDVYENGKKIAFHHIFKAVSDEPVSYDTNEIEEVRFFSIEELKHLSQQVPDQFFKGLLKLIKENKL